MQKITKCVLVGDSGVGKTSMSITFTTNTFPADYLPTVSDITTLAIPINEETTNLAIWDTNAYEEGYERLRPLAYPQTDVFLCVFSVANLSSFENVRVKWVPEVSHHCPWVPVVLVGNKVDLRGDLKTVGELLEKHSGGPVSCEQGVEMAKEIGAVKYLECSALTQVGLREVFVDATRIGLTPHQPKHPGRTCLLQ
uniref:Uncharacterized protein n=1 Tax=Arcella intermedia TaxID=1963864 RepID=A0A6B2LJL0_9EUKA|eukprot:TRINITY_DN13134_c0_g1_i3.p1 TRINITY_DN13134_c0_g1~~TRINITY_DN13134_c0_g1_i3.p1  ORF type:complete len:196 (-),score=53.79 TRINITY_DN13134_c0_g1_i3:37-624(-)